MRRSFVHVTLFCLLVAASCSQPGSSTSSDRVDSLKTLVSIVEIPASDLPRAMRFYSAILGVEIGEVPMGEVTMGVLPATNGSPQVVLVQGPGYVPTNDGPIIYLNGGSDLQTVLDRVEPNGGKVLVPKTVISPDMGNFALFLDAEGNRMGLHSYR